ncbi:MAG: site-2 protease family protein [Bacteroidota bacterium]|nr:site-2 protease family protein [Rhodothermia bacterium]MCS7155432.1 site-2 protease family protein [Bacteroidota bacterium]MDW8138469.1 site-2 protease family protein [Bacteroidota bacterium]MDW8284594.1 site-2 protease family protein [Bacteroidota bacterium]
MEPRQPVAAPEAAPTEALLARTSRPWVHVLLFVLTFLSVTYAGIGWVGRDLVHGANWWGYVQDSLHFTIPFLLFLTAHEFGHYLAARRHGVRTTLPYYIPMPFISPIGTLGAVIRIQEKVPDSRKLFDIGIAGPLAGFVVSLATLLYGFLTLPPPTYMLQFGGHAELHAHLLQYGTFAGYEPSGNPLRIGSTPLYWLLSQLSEHTPPMYEMYHYPYLLAGWLGLFFTALNLLPIGQLDGGHIAYALLGPRWHGQLARFAVLLLLYLGGVGLIRELGPVLYESHSWGVLWTWLLWILIAAYFVYRLYGPDWGRALPVLIVLLVCTQLADWIPQLAAWGYSGWLLWVVLLIAIIRIDHPPVLYFVPLDFRRRALGWLGFVLFVLCFSPTPFNVAF